MIQQIRNKKYPNAKKLFIMDEKGIQSIVKFTMDEFVLKLKS